MSTACPLEQSLVFLVIVFETKELYSAQLQPCVNDFM